MKKSYLIKIIKEIIKEEAYSEKPIVSKDAARTKDPVALKSLKKMVSEVTIDTSIYKNTNGKAPSGTGGWVFQFDKDDDFLFLSSMKYGDALKKAKEEAKVRKASKITVMP